MGRIVFEDMHGPLVNDAINCRQTSAFHFLSRKNIHRFSFLTYFYTKNSTLIGAKNQVAYKFGLNMFWQFIKAAIIRSLFLISDI